MKKQKALNLINQIQKIRKKNNVNWMDMLRLAFKHDPKNASKIIKLIEFGLGRSLPIYMNRIRLFGGLRPS